ncbi:MAG: sensor histidine kinase, partial [Flavobacteriaceae bacterium]|nr:sensor histidine kinase [Flavobacteriaceae bacterium]
QSSKINEELEKYVQSLNQNNQEVIIANAYLDFHDIVLFLIQNKNEEAKALLDKNLSVAKKFNDKPLQIASLYYSCNYYMNVQNLQEYINTCESIIKLEEKLPQHTQYYRGTLMNTIDAYVYKGGYENEVDTLLLKLYSNPKTREDSYPFYAKYLKYLSLESERVNKIFNQFEVNNILEFGEKIKVLAKPKLNTNDYYYIYYDMGEALEKHGYLKEALKYQRDAVALNKQIYSEDLSKSLANFQTQQAVKEKELEIEFAEKKSKLYIVIASLIGLALFFTALFLIKNKKQTRQLDEQNKQINEALKENKLLVKEIHHRVKNNFQMVSSLLDLQTRDIKDAKAKELAKEGQNRIKSMALIHQKLYQKEDGLIDFADYLKILVNQIQSLFKDDKDVKVNIKTEALYLDVDTALPLGLIVNELLTNTFKYGLMSGKENIISIEVIKLEKGTYTMKFSDNGNGLKENMNIKNAKSLGLKLISRLTRQLQGTLKYNYNNGAVFIITFKDIFARKLVD